MKKFYITAGVLLATAVLFTALTGAFDAAALIVFNLVALGLFYALALRSAIAKTREVKT